MTDDAKAFGPDAWVHCEQHGRPHTTGWCTVRTSEKTLLTATDPRALVAAALERAEDVARTSHLHWAETSGDADGAYPVECDESACENIAFGIRALTPDDARAAFDSAIREAEERGAKREREACADVADDHTPGKHGGAPLAAHVTGRAIAAAIRARDTAQ